MKETTVSMIDIYEPEKGVEILVNTSVGSKYSTTVWVNVDGICKLRITNVRKDALAVVVEGNETIFTR